VRNTIVLHGSDELAVHRDREALVVVLEYAVHGQAVSAGHAYDNRFVSVITIKDRKVTHWRDYLDPVAVFDAVGWARPPCGDGRPADVRARY
jgi:ketosteroid isomerase-like protein